jgi:Uri superfamily endonuclease
MMIEKPVPDSGVYVLVSILDRQRSILVGSLGRFIFPRGNYAYVGRAKRNLTARIARHRRDQKILHWHIDYFLRYARIVRVVTFGFSEEGECRVGDYFRTAPGVTVAVNRFGASDCRCPSHFFFLGNTPRIDLHTKQLSDLLEC